MSINYIKQGALNTIVLGKLFQAAQTDKPAISEDELVEYFAKWVGAQRVRLAISSAHDREYIQDVGDGGDYIFVISSAGYKLIEEMYLKEGSPTQRLIDDGFEKYFESIASNEEESTNSSIPASDRMVQIGDNLPGYGEVLENVEAVDVAIRGDNSMAADERSWIRIHLDAGLTLLKKGGQVLKSALDALLVEPIKEALKESSTEHIKKILQAALTAIKTYLGIGS